MFTRDMGPEHNQMIKGPGMPGPDNTPPLVTTKKR